MNQPSRMTLLAIWTLLVFTAGAGALAIDDDRGTASTSTAAPPRALPTSSTTATPSEAGEGTLRGVVESVDLAGRIAQGMPLPLTFATIEPGAGNGADLTGVLVGPDVATIVWDAGRPLVLGGDGTVTFDAVTLSLDEGVMAAGVGGTTAEIGPGTYQIDTPVAVGRGGLAEPRDSVTFFVGATEAPTLTFRGVVAVGLPHTTITITGSGRGTLEGLFVLGADGTEQSATRIELRGGDFEFVFAPSQLGWSVEGTLPDDATFE